MPAPHPLTPLLAPSSVAIFGASNDPTRISGRSLRYYREAGYKGALYPINPTRDQVQGLKAYPDIAAISGPVECAVIAVPANLAVEAMESCVAKGVKAVVMFTAGFAEIGAEGREMQTRITQIARDGGIRLCGPNCLGLFNMRTGHTPTFSSFLEEGPTPAGPLGMVTQSGAFGTHLLALTARRGISVGVWLSTGNEADVSVADGISFLADDPDTKAIACYVEAIKDGAAFAEAVARARANGKPVIAMKVGSSTVGAAAAASHTASLAGADAIYDAAFRQLAVERAKTPEDLVNIAYACTRGRLPSSRRLAVMTMSGGAGVLMADASEEGGLELTPLSEEAQKEVISWVPFAASRNPVDVTAQVLNDPSILDKSFDLLFGKENFPAMVAFFTTWASSPQMAEPLFKAVSGAAARYPDRYFALSAIATPEMQRRYEEAGVGLFEDPWRAVEFDRRRGARRRAARREAAAGPAGAGEPAAAAEGPHRRARGEAHPGRSRHPGARRAARHGCGRGRPGRAADRRAAGAEDRVGRHPAQNRDGRRHARHPGGRGRRRVRPHDRAHQGARAARPARRRADLADAARRHRDDPRRAERPGVRPGRHARAGRHLRRGTARRDVPHRAVRGRGGAPHDRRIARPGDARRRARPAALRSRRAGRRRCRSCRSSPPRNAPSSPASTSTRCWCARRARARRRSTR